LKKKLSEKDTLGEGKVRKGVRIKKDRPGQENKHTKLFLRLPQSQEERTGKGEKKGILSEDWRSGQKK